MFTLRSQKLYIHSILILNMNKRGLGAKLKIVIVLIIVILAIAIYFTFFYSYKCKDISCFREHQKRCNLISSKTTFVNDIEDATWFYHIKGKKGNECKVQVKLLQVKKGDVSFSKLEGQSMNCYVPIGSVVAPESDISNCHGLLKEDLQETIINKLHKYIVNNLGEISEELEKPL